MSDKLKEILRGMADLRRDLEDFISENERETIASDEFMRLTFRFRNPTNSWAEFTSDRDALKNYIDKRLNEALRRGKGE